MKDKLNEILRNVMKLLSARDKTLWEGEAGKGDTLKITMCQYYNRVGASETQTTIKKIIGVEPIMEKIVGGMGAAPKRIFGRFPDLVGRCLA